ncbi:hypothetical protein Q7P37_005065 [Cladosporium fusiforme]
MTNDNDRSDRAVAYLLLYRGDDLSSYVDLPIHANAEFDFGREQVGKSLGLDDSTISRHHLRFHCVTFGENNIAPVAPMVYVRTISRHRVHLTQVASNGSTSTCFLERGQPSVLLNHGDLLQLSSKIFLRYDGLVEEEDEQSSLEPVMKAEARCFEKQYTIIPRTLGSGGFASVFLAINNKSRRQVACKIVPLPSKPPVPSLSDWTSKPGKMAPAHEATARIIAHRKKCQSLRREFEILKGVDHPNVIRLEKAIYATDHIYIFQELVSGGDLLSYLEMRNGLDETEAAVITFQLLKAVEYLHSRGIVHRDIKPENILMTSWRKGARIVLTDFGQSRKLVENEGPVKEGQAASRMQSLVGTRGYTAPEVYHRNESLHTQRQPGYNETVDIWSVGCLAGTLITNSFLFAPERSVHSAEINSDDTQFLEAFGLDFLDTSAEWQGASDRCKSFVRCCATLDETQRMSVAQALQHPWVADPGFVAAMHAEYARAIADWKPRNDTQDLIEYVKNSARTAKVPETGYEARLHQEVRSHYFPSQLPPLPSNIGSIDFSSHTAKHTQARLSPIDGSRALAAKFNTKETLAMSQGNSYPATSTNTKRPDVEENMSYLSIQDYDPPDSYPATTEKEESQWGQRLAMSIYEEGQHGKSDAAPSRKRLRF